MGEMIVAHDIRHGLKANQQIKADGLRRSRSDHRAFDHNAGAGVLPQRHNQLAHQCRDHHPLEAAAILCDRLIEPTSGDWTGFNLADAMACCFPAMPKTRRSSTPLPARYLLWTLTDPECAPINRRPAPTSRLLPS